MLDYVCIFTKGGTLLWALSFVGALKGDPVNALIRACLLEERAAQSAYEYIIPSGGAYTLKWTLNNVGAAGKAPGSAGTPFTGSTQQPGATPLVTESCLLVSRSVQSRPKRAAAPFPLPTLLRDWAWCLWQCTRRPSSCSMWMSCWSGSTRPLPRATSPVSLSTQSSMPPSRRVGPVQAGACSPGHPVAASAESLVAASCAGVLCACVLCTVCAGLFD